MTRAADALLAFELPIKGLADPVHHLLGLLYLKWWRAWVKDLDVPIPTITRNGDHQGNPRPTVRTLQADHAWARDFIPGMGIML
jgi:hypothetical protein